MAGLSWAHRMLTAYQTIGAGDGTTITDWTVGGSSIDWIHGYWEGSSGSLADKSVDLSGNGHGSISQLISDLVSGQWYKLTFDTALNPDEMPPPAISQSLSLVTRCPKRGRYGNNRPEHRMDII